MLYVCILDSPVTLRQVRNLQMNDLLLLAWLFFFRGRWEGKWVGGGLGVGIEIVS